MEHTDDDAGNALLSCRVCDLFQATAFAFRSFPPLLRPPLAFAPSSNKRHHHHHVIEGLALQVHHALTAMQALDLHAFQPLRLPRPLSGAPPASSL